MGNLEELKKKFFTEEEEPEEVTLASLIERTNRFIKVGKSGKIYFQMNNFTSREKVALILIGRHFAHLLDKEVPLEISVEEIQKFTSLPGLQIYPRIHDLKFEGLIQDADKEEHYKIRDPSRIEKFLDEMDKHYPIKKK
jgi:hypothetical protein